MEEKTSFIQEVTVAEDSLPDGWPQDILQQTTSSGDFKPNKYSQFNTDPNDTVIDKYFSWPPC